jgi:bacterial/archaeal transporter family-2 protein
VCSVAPSSCWRSCCCRRSARLFALVIAGQVLAAVTLDHFGAFGLTPHPIGAARLAGAVLLIAGVVLIRE